MLIGSLLISQPGFMFNRKIMDSNLREYKRVKAITERYLF